MKPIRPITEDRAGARRHRPPRLRLGGPPAVEPGQVLRDLHRFLMNEMQRGSDLDTLRQRSLTQLLRWTDADAAVWGCTDDRGAAEPAGAIEPAPQASPQHADVGVEPLRSELCDALAETCRVVAMRSTHTNGRATWTARSPDGRIVAVVQEFRGATPRCTRSILGLARRPTRPPLSVTDAGRLEVMLSEVAWFRCDRPEPGPTQSLRARLSPGEQAVWDLLLQARARDEIAERLSISRYAVDSCCRRIFAVAGVHSQVGLIRRYRTTWR